MRILRLALLLLLFPAAPSLPMTLDEFRAVPDNRVAVRTSLGVRGARAVDATHVELVIGMSVTDACRNPEAYRVLSFADERYAYGKFVRPVGAEARVEPEAEAPDGCPFKRFERTRVMLRLPLPLREGIAYTLIAQGVGGTMVTGAHTAASFTYRPGTLDATADPAVDLAALGLRRVEPVGPSLILLEFGPDFAPAPGSDPRSYQVRVAGRPVPVSRLGRISRIDTYLPVGWPFAAIPMHELFLELAQPFRDGERIEVEVSPRVTRAASTAALAYGDLTSLSNSIKVNQLGYLPDSPAKIAYLGRWMGSFPEKPVVRAAEGGGRAEERFWKALAAETPREGAAPAAGPANPSLLFGEEPEFRVCEAESRRVVFTGKARLVHRSGSMDEGVFNVDHSGENVYLLDFSAFKTPGRYFLSVPQVGRSLPFEISSRVYERAFQVQAYGVFAQRCGIELAPPYSEWRRVACHRKGVVPTTQSRLAEHEIRDLARQVDYDRPVEEKANPALAALDTDPELLARWPLDGDLRDASGKGHDLQPAVEGQPFSPDRQLFARACRVLGPTPAAGPMGGSAAALAVDPAKGFTLGGWLRYDQGDQFDGSLFTLREGKSGRALAQLWASWGLWRANAGPGTRDIQGVRVGDGKWHHLALVRSPAGRGAPELSFYLDGTRVGTSAAADAGRADTLTIGALSGKQAGGKYLADYRLYGRALTADEVRTLATRWGEQARTLPTYGGHHDAGDYNPRSHIDVAQVLMDAYEIAPRKFRDGQLNLPEKGNGIPDILDEANWALRLWTGLQDADGGVFAGTESNGDPNFIQTADLDVLGDFAYAKDAAASFTFAATFAQAARIRRSLGRKGEADDLLARARRAYEWAAGHPPKPGGDPAAYAAAFLSPKACAAAELLLTTGEPRFRDDFAAACVWAKKPDAELEVYRLYDQSRAAWAYARCNPAAADPALQRAAREAVIRYADTFITYNAKMAYAFLRHPWSPISWGTGAQLHWAMPAVWAWALTHDENYRLWIIRSCDNTLGANPLNRSYIVGLGTRTVRAPLHNSRYSHLGEVVDGMQVNGPLERGEGYNVSETAYPRIRPDFANLYTFVDCHFAISMDEGLVRSQAEAMAVFGLLMPDAQP